MATPRSSGTIYAVHVSDSTSGLEKIVTVEARTPEDAYRRIERTGYRIVQVTPAQPGIAAGVVMNPPPPPESVAGDPPETLARRQRQHEQAQMIHHHNLLTLWPILAGIGSILWGLFKWLDGNNVQAFISAVLGVVMTVAGAVRRWTQDRGPWR